MADSDEQLLSRTYDAFNARDVDAVLATMHPDVDWPNVIEATRLRGHDAVRAYWEKQFSEVDPRVLPIGFSRGRVIVQVHQVVRDLEGEVLVDQQVQHVYTLRDGLVERMDVRES